MPQIPPRKRTSSKRTHDGEEKPAKGANQPTEKSTTYTCITCQSPVQDNATKAHRRSHLDHKRHVQIRKHLQIYDSIRPRFRNRAPNTPLQLTHDDKLVSGRYECCLCNETWRKCEKEAADKHFESEVHHVAVQALWDVVQANRHRVTKLQKGRVPMNRRKRTLYECGGDGCDEDGRTSSKKQKKN